MSKKKDEKPFEEPEAAAAQEEEIKTEAAPEASAEPEAPSAEALLAAEKDRYLRLAAEYDNYRKRSQREYQALFADVRADTISQILPVYDNLLRAIDTPCSDEAYAKGVEMTMSQLMTIFDKLGVKPIEALGKTFDPALMNAVMHTEDEALGENVVVEEFQRGFTLGDKVIRHSMVKVAN
jgi:molecular chaperone GrpE